IAPLVPPVIVTLETVIVEAFAVRIPPLPTFNAPPVNPRFAVARAVVDDPSETVSVPAQFMALVDIVKICTDAAEEPNMMLLNSLPERSRPRTSPFHRAHRSIVPARARHPKPLAAKRS